MSSTKTAKIGFIGTGVMGRHMASHLLDAGHELHIHTRTKSKAQPLLDRAAIWHDTVADLAPYCDAVFAIVGFPPDVESTFLGATGLIENMKPGTIVVDMTTSRPDLAVKIADAAQAGGGAALDAPVSGGDIGAKEARLSIMVGGDRDAYDRVLPLFEIMGRNIVYQGKAGSGQFCKMCNQIVIASGMVGIAESMAYAKKSGLDPHTVLRSIANGAAGSWALSNLAPRMIDGDFEPGFYVKHFIKDMTIALESATALGLDAPGLALAKSRYEQLADQDDGQAEDDGTHALFKLYNADAAAK